MREIDWKKILLTCGIVVSGVCLVIAVTPALVGFSSSGVAAGSAAAAWQASIGNVAAGSLFAFL